MGMSGDFEQAVRGGHQHACARMQRRANVRHTDACAPQIEMGSTNVRVGSTIFGARDYGKQQ